MLAGLTIVPDVARAQDFDNGSVVELHKAGLGAGAVVAKINAMPCKYDVSTAALIRLRQADVPSTAIAAMIDRCAGASLPVVSATDPAVMHPPGIYVVHSWEQPPVLTLMRPSKAGSVKLSGNGSLLWPRVSTLLIPDPGSQNTVGTRTPVFYFYFAPDDRRVSDFGSATSSAAQSPGEFTLVALKVTDQARAVSIGHVTALHGRLGVDPKSAIRFTSEEVGSSMFKVTPGAALAPGEYAFIITGANNAARVYDFSIR